MMQTTTLPARAEVAAQLAAALGTLMAAQDRLLETTATMLHARMLLARHEDSVLLADPVQLDGKNAEVRAAQLRALTANERLEADQAEWERTQAVAALDMARETVRVWRSTAALVAMPE
jgi:hypothetical protein